MEEIVHKHLSRHYKLGVSELGNYGIYNINKSSLTSAPVYSNKLIDSISYLFNLTKTRAKRYINSWAKSVDSCVNLKFYWKTIESLLPFATKINVKTIANDIITVKPMSFPLNIIYLPLT